MITVLSQRYLKRECNELSVYLNKYISKYL